MGVGWEIFSNNVFVSDTNINYIDLCIIYTEYLSLNAWIAVNLMGDWLLFCVYNCRNVVVLLHSLFENNIFCSDGGILISDCVCREIFNSNIDDDKSISTAYIKVSFANT